MLNFIKSSVSENFLLSKRGVTATSYNRAGKATLRSELGMEKAQRAI